MRQLVQYSAFLLSLLVTAKPGEGDPQMLGGCNPLTAEDDANAQTGKQKLIESLTASNELPLSYKPQDDLPGFKVCRQTVAGMLYVYTWTKEEDTKCQADGNALCHNKPQIPGQVRLQCKATYLVKRWEQTENEFKMGNCEIMK